MSPFQKLAILALIVLGPALRPAYAAGKYPNSLTMTCAQAKAYIDKNDGAMLATGDARASFHSVYCSGQPAYVKAKDSNYCFVGQYCDCVLTFCTQHYFQCIDR